ncbi:MAG TPA: 2OG-Fe(II) oxygenase [Stellaceae bacterium]|nr:2OG-Fe(II) oxygenase [Stellaceae bacterium]
MTSLKDISPFYARIYEYALSPEFLVAMSAITGIPDLLADPRMYGGGTHENVHGQELDPHVDFNYDIDHGYHRRLNLLVYLNKEWDQAWGGAIELHSNPREPKANQIKSFVPLFNRAVIFETNEHSWHGFPKIELPPEKRRLSRKSLSVYLYTRTRPENEIVPEHGTFYVQRPLPPYLRPGHVLSAADIEAIDTLLVRRDGWIKHYQDLEIQLKGEIQTHGGHIRRMLRDTEAQSRYINQLLKDTKAPVTGAAKPHGESTGLFPDGWATNVAAFSAVPRGRSRGFAIRGWVPDHFPSPNELEVLVNGTSMAKRSVAAGKFEIRVDRGCDASPLRIEIRAAKSFNAAALGVGADERDLAYLLDDIQFF